VDSWNAAKRLWGKRGGRIVAGLVFSHWVLDLLVHRADLPIMPGNLGGLPYLGFGIWEHPSISIDLESLLIGVGLILYLRFVLKNSKSRAWAWAYAGVMGILLLLSLITDVNG
jgi:hypothetical protein